VEYLIKDLLSNHILNMIDREIEKLKDRLVDEGKEELSDAEIIFRKMSMVEDFTGDDKDSPKSKRYLFFSKHLMERIEGLRAEIDPEEFDSLNIRENLKKIIDIENIRNRGFNTAINSITSILDTSKMGYQYVENLKNARELILREYEDTNSIQLPDERFVIRMKYYDNAQLIEERRAYDVQITSFEIEVQHMWDVLDIVYQDSKFLKGVVDFSDLARRKKNKIRNKIKAKTGDPLYEDIDKMWDETTFIKPSDTDVERMNRTYIFEKSKVKKRLILMRDKLANMYGFGYPKRRRVMEERLSFLNSEFQLFDYKINPYHVQPGLLLDVDITSIKKKKATLDGMANVLNEFLHGVSKGFQDAAFASFSRRRSTVREDIAQSFAGSEGEGGEGSEYLSMISSTPQSTGTTKKKSGGKKKSGDSLKEI
jgi:hypothetical protein